MTLSKNSLIQYTLLEEFLPKRPSKSDRRRMQIIEQTIIELAATGPEQTNYESLAKACGISRALVQHYFPDRDELVLTALKYVRAQFQKLCVDAIDLQTSPRAKLKAYIETACSWPKVTPANSKVWLLFFYRCGINLKYRRLNTELVERGHLRLQALLQEVAIESQRPALDQKSFILPAKLIQNAITSYFVSTVTEIHSKEFNEDLLSAIVELCLKIADSR